LDGTRDISSDEAGGILNGVAYGGRGNPAPRRGEELADEIGGAATVVSTAVLGAHRLAT